MKEASHVKINHGTDQQNMNVCHFDSARPHETRKYSIESLAAVQLPFKWFYETIFFEKLVCVKTAFDYNLE